MYKHYPYPAKAQKSDTEFIFGTRAVIEAIKAGKEIDKILIKKQFDSELYTELMDRLKGSPIPVQRVPVEKLNRITAKNHQGVIAYLSEVTYQHLEDIIPALYEAGEMPFLMMLDGITDVRNLGAIARTCECAGIHAMVVPTTNSASINADAIKTSAGALHTMPVCREKSLREALIFLKNSGVKIIAASEKAAKLHSSVDYSGPLALIMGAEDTGVSTELTKLCDELVRIPMKGKIASLNVSVAAGILMFEALKSR